MKSKRRTPQQSKKRPAMAVSMLSMVGAKTVSFLIGFVLGALFFLAIAQEGYLGDVVLVRDVHEGVGEGRREREVVDPDLVYQRVASREASPVVRP